MPMETTAASVGPGAFLFFTAMTFFRWAESSGATEVVSDTDGRSVHLVSCRAVVLSFGVCAEFDASALEDQTMSRAAVAVELTDEERATVFKCSHDRHCRR